MFVLVWRRAVTRALEEDLGIIGDITTMCVVVEDSFVEAKFASRVDGVLAGTSCATETYRQLDPTIEVEWSRDDGEPLTAELLASSLDALKRQRLARRQRELKSLIAEAERKQDAAELGQLLREKLDLDRTLRSQDSSL